MRYALILFMALSMFACGDSKPPAGPAEVHYGEDVCDRCKMIISDQRFAAQYVMNDGRVKKFDDFGCMAAELGNDGGKDEVGGIYVTDFATGSWLDARKAHYLKSPDIASPMGYGIAAFGSLEALKSDTQYRPGAEISGFDDIME
jgi:copper chaperone NosL